MAMAETENTECVVYVALALEGAECWRPAFAEPVSKDVFRLIAPDDYNPEHEEWEFAPRLGRALREHDARRRRISGRCGADPGRRDARRLTPAPAGACLPGPRRLSQRRRARPCLRG